jgi:hypothetical protein
MSKPRMQSIRFSEEDYILLREIAKTKDKKFSTLIRDCCFAYLQNNVEHEHLLNALQPEDPKEFQKTFFDVLNNSNDAVLKSVEKFHSDMLIKFNLIDRLLRKVIYLQFLHSRELSEEDYGNQAKSAKRRIREFLEDIDSPYQTR